VQLSASQEGLSSMELVNCCLLLCDVRTAIAVEATKPAYGMLRYILNNLYSVLLIDRSQDKGELHTARAAVGQSAGRWLCRAAVHERRQACGRWGLQPCVRQCGVQPQRNLLLHQASVCVCSCPALSLLMKLHLLWNMEVCQNPVMNSHHHTLFSF
jgi:hypothetical protein